MPYRNKTYVALDYDNDSRSYNLMKAWKANDNVDFNFHNAHELTTIRDWSKEDSIKASLRERMANSKIFVLLIGTNTRFCNTYVKWEIELALKKGLPIIGVNLDGTKDYNEYYCPKTLREELAIHVPFSQKVLTYALDNWPDSHANHVKGGVTGPRWYKEHVLESLGVTA